MAVALAVCDGSMGPESRFHCASVRCEAGAGLVPAKGMRPVIADYDEIFSLLARGKTRRLTERLAGIEEYRGIVLHRMDQIADYLNWYEATQLGMRSNAFDSYLKAANEVTREEAHRNGPIARYLDSLEKEY